MLTFPNDNKVIAVCVCDGPCAYSNWIAKLGNNSTVNLRRLHSKNKKGILYEGFTECQS
jgi:hypothetical protein